MSTNCPLCGDIIPSPTCDPFVYWCCECLEPFDLRDDWAVKNPSKKERNMTEQIIIRNVMYREAILAIQCARIAKAASEENWFDWIETWDDGTLMESIPEDITAQEWFDKQYPIIESLLKETMEDN